MAKINKSFLQSFVLLTSDFIRKCPPNDENAQIVFTSSKVMRQKQFYLYSSVNTMYILKEKTVANTEK